MILTYAEIQRIGHCSASINGVSVSDVLETFNKYDGDIKARQLHIEANRLSLKRLRNDLQFEREARMKLDGLYQEVVSQNTEYSRELARLRPPEPKFKVGQVVYNHRWPGQNGLLKITAISYEGAGALKGYWYQHGEGKTYCRSLEDNLRALTEVEKGSE